MHSKRLLLLLSPSFGKAMPTMEVVSSSTAPPLVFNGEFNEKNARCPSDSAEKSPACGCSPPQCVSESLDRYCDDAVSQNLIPALNQILQGGSNKAGNDEEG
jgi:hypothetical protein